MRYNIQHQKYQKGLSLLELIISLTIGLILLIGLTEIYQIGNRASIESNNIASLNEKARRIMTLLSNDLQQAGYVDPFDENPNLRGGETNASVLFDFNDENIRNIYERLENPAAGTAAPVTTLEAIKGLVPVIGCPSHMAGNPSVATPTAGTAVLPGLAPSVAVPACDTTRGSASEQALQITYQAISSSAAAAPLRSLQTQANEDGRRSGAAQDCLGANIDPDITADGGFVSNRYFLDDGEFRCVGSASAAGGPQTLVDDVDEFVIRYRVTSGTDPAAATPVVSGEQTTQFITAEQLRDPANLPLGWASITGVQVCLVMTGDALDGMRQQNIADVQPQIPSCVTPGTKARDAGDNRYYKRFVSTFSLPNMLYNIPAP